ncbi:tellurite resistance TerB family protein [Sedimenticola sp.]|uniref:tellurite resistance TerB family protein n=1 Tax=Sedimenticola sp. TaxID=1940285 RepID=UPI00258D4B07|nr:tellurite resistance TerB family protein [Sedimenticola sp.]MCW8902701.1 tellurite resistance TerB family protein [Sedimenticola sp.]
MDTRGLLDQLLGAGKSLLNDAGVTNQQGGVTDYGKGAVTGGLIGLLLGSKTGRKLATYGGLAALGTMAWRAYSQNRAEASGSAPQKPAIDNPAESRAVLRAVLAAARVDGHIDDRERALIDQEVSRHGGDSALRAWMETELNLPLDPRSIAAEVGGDKLLASEVYLASALVVGEAGFLERSYLDQLATELGLDADLKRRLEGEAVGNPAS